MGLGSLLASAMTGAAATIVAAVALRRHFHTFRWSWLIPALGLVAGVTNAGFVWGTVHGTVMRVLLLFYLTRCGPRCWPGCGCTSGWARVARRCSWWRSAAPA